MGGVISSVLRRVEGSAVSVFSVVCMFAGAFAVGVMVGGVVWKSALMVSAPLSGNCGICCSW